MEVRTGLSHGLPDPENLGYSGFPRAGKGKLPDRLRGKGRPPLPDLSRKILKKKPSALPGGKALKLCSQTMAHHAAVKGQKAFFGETRGQLLRKGGNTRLPHAVEVIPSRQAGAPPGGKYRPSVQSPAQSADTASVPADPVKFDKNLLASKYGAGYSDP